MDERVSKFGIPLAVSVVSFGIGVGVGYLLGKRRKYTPTHIVPAVKRDFSEVQEEIEHTLTFFEQEDKKGRDLTKIKPGEIETFVAEKLKESMTTQNDPDADEPVQQSIFAETTSEWNYEHELEMRDEARPYIIHKDEFYGEERGYSQTTLTYYAGDNIMVDEEDSPVYNHNIVVGELVFGHGSGDPNVVYIRNAARKAEYEVLFDPGLYSTEVLGLDIEPNERVKELKHGPPKFRRE